MELKPIDNQPEGVRSFDFCVGYLGGQPSPHYDVDRVLSMYPGCTVMATEEPTNQRTRYTVTKNQ